MISKRQSISWLRLAPVLALGLSLAGCRDALGPEPMPVARVSGKLTDGGRPVGGGWIEFYPVDGTVGRIRSTRVRANGSFETDGVPVGLNLVRVINQEVLTATGSKRIFGVYFSPIRRVIPAEPAGPISIDLLDEAIRLQESRTTPAASRSPGAGDAR